MEVLVLLLVGAAVFAAIRHMKLHKSACSGSCAGCGAKCPNRK